MQATIFYSVAEYCDHSAKMTIKWQDKAIKTEIWSSDDNEVEIQEKTYRSVNKASQEYYIALGKAISGGWKVLNACPLRETWETKRSK